VADAVISPTSAPHDVIITDEQQIVSIVTSLSLSPANLVANDVAVAMESLAMLLSSTRPRIVKRIKRLPFTFGALLPVVQAMRRHANLDTDSHDVQSMGIIVLGLIASCNFESFKPAIIAIGGLTCCREALKLYDNTLYLQSNGCLFIAYLWSSVDLRQKVVDAGGLKEVIETMEDFEDVSAVQERGTMHSLHRSIKTVVGPRRLLMPRALVVSVLQ
jgi:hypothetical protein